MIFFIIQLACSKPQPDPQTDEPFLSCWPNSKSIPALRKEGFGKPDFFVLDSNAKRLIAYNEHNIISKAGVLFCFHLDMMEQPSTGWGVITRSKHFLQIELSNETIFIYKDQQPNKTSSISAKSFDQVFGILQEPQHIFIIR